MKFIKKQSASTWITLLTLILAIVSFIIYGINVSSAGYFKSTTSSSLVTASIWEIIVIVLILAVSQVNSDGALGKMVDIVAGLLKILAAVLPIIALLGFVDTRIEGLAYIYFSNEEVLATIQTAENLSSAMTAIVGCIMYGVTAVVAIIAAFFSPVKKAKKLKKATAKA